MKEHHYHVKLSWTDENGKGTTSYTDYSRNHQVNVKGKPALQLSSDPAFRGDATKYNPEDVLVASLASCHMLWYLHLCSKSGITVVKYEDNAEGLMLQEETGGGRFDKVILHPEITILEKDKIELAHELHKESNQKCYIANSCNFPIKHQVKIVVADS
jgi:organic hydroperoxide reductase OsmC/OhrA